MKLVSATILTASLVPYLRACQSPLRGGDGGMPECYTFKKRKFIVKDCTKKSTMKLQIKDNGKMCMKSRCMSYKLKNGKVVIKMGKKGTPITFEQVAGKRYIVATSPKEVKGQYPRFSDGKILFDADGNKGVITCTVPTTPAPTTPAPTTLAPTTLAPTTPAPTTTQTGDYELHSGACMVLSDRWPTVKHPKSVKRREVYNGGRFEDFYVVADQSITSCKVLCDKESWCIGFEFATSAGRESLKYKAFLANDCQLNFNDPKYDLRAVCEGWGLDYYERKTPATTTPAPTTLAPTTLAPTTLAPTKDYVLHAGGCMVLSDRWPTVKHPKSVKRRQVYHNGTFEDFYVVADQSVTSCKVLCDKESWCIGFEFATSVGRDSLTFKAFLANDCQLNFNDPKYKFWPTCNGWGLDYYEVTTK